MIYHFPIRKISIYRYDFNIPVYISWHSDVQRKRPRGGTVLPPEIFTEGTNFERDGENIMFTPVKSSRRVQTWREMGVILCLPPPVKSLREVQILGEIRKILCLTLMKSSCGVQILRKMRKILSLEGRREVQIFKGWLQILTPMRTIIQFPS